jgi:hypothetical protein
MTDIYPNTRRRANDGIFFAINVCVIMAAAAAAAHAQFLHPKVSVKQTTIRRVVILPAKVDVVRDSMKGPEGMAAESEALSSRVEDAVADVLNKQKSITRIPGPTGSSGDADAQAKYSVADMQSKFDELLPKVIKKRSDVKKGRFTLGDEVLNLSLDKTADAIIFIRGRGQKLTSGKKTFTLLVGGAPAFLSLQIGMVDAHTGDLLVYSEAILVGDPTTAVDRLRKALEKSFKKLPTAETRP